MLIPSGFSYFSLFSANVFGNKELSPHLSKGESLILFKNDQIMQSVLAVGFLRTMPVPLNDLKYIHNEPSL